MSLTEELRKGYAPGVPFTVDAGEKTMPEILFDAAKRYPQRTALDFMSQQTTYEALVNKVLQAATALASAGVRPGDRVALVMPNCPQHVVALFATWVLGAVAVEHNPLAPQEELRQEFERHGSRIVVAWEKSVEKLSFLDSGCVIFGVDLAADLSRATRVLLHVPISAVRERKKALGAKTPPSVRSWHRAVRNAKAWPKGPFASADDTALLIHTGGTTGVPKAVALTHRNLASNVAQSVAWVAPLHEGSEVFYSVLPYFHAFGMTATLLCGLRLGATIAIFPKFDVAQVLLSQRRLPCTFFVGVPPMFDRLLSELEELPTDLSSIAYTLSGAMALSQELSDRWEEATGGLVVEGYGMTEGSPILLGSPLSPNKRAGALGLPFPSTEIRIVDPDNTDEDVPSGEVGELLVRGPQVFHGYWDNEAETAEVLRDGWLHTGDLVRVRDGFVYMADRRKELIITGGFNVYPSQVEDVVRSMPGVRDVAVVGLPSRRNAGEDVVAALVLEAGASLTLADVREWASKSLANYALPRQIVVVQELPRSQLGKVMRRHVNRQLTEMQAELKSGLHDLAAHVTDLASDLLHRPSKDEGGNATDGADDVALIKDHEAQVACKDIEETIAIDEGAAN